MTNGSATLFWSALDAEGAEGSRSGDPLGLRVLIRHLGGRISPALTRSSTRVWGFGLLALGVRLAGYGSNAERSFLRWQRLLVLAAANEASRSGDEVDAGWRVGGITRATRMVEQSSKVRLDRPLLTHERASGLWGGYARAARMYGIVTPGRLGQGASCTPPGDQLANATRSTLRPNQQERRLRAIVAGKDDLEVDLDDLHLSLADLGAMPSHLSRILERADRQFVGGRFSQLWPQLGEMNAPHPGEVDLDALMSADLRQLLIHQRDVAGLVEEVEGAFRSSAADRFTPDLATHPGFAHAHSYGYAAAYDPVAEALTLGGEGTRVVLQRLHEDRHPRAGRWRPDEEVQPWKNVIPDFGLDAIHMLAREGVTVDS
jgi:hypothetical protein